VSGSAVACFGSQPNPAFKRDCRKARQPLNFTLGFMDSYILSFSSFLVEIFFWVGVPFLLLGMLLGLGFQSKHPISIAIALIGFAGFSCWGLGLSLEGLVTGEALSISRSWGVVSKSQTPLGYWLAFGFWMSSSLLLLGFCFWGIFRVIKNPNPAFKRDAEKRGAP
jgi:hypothetical protein